MPSRRHPSSRHAFTLVELLVVIGIIALLIAVLLPVLGRARFAAATTSNLSNLRQIGMGLDLYRNDNIGRYPKHSSLNSETVNLNPPRPRYRWADVIHTYLEVEQIFTSPLLDDIAAETQMRPWAHTCNPATGLPYEHTRYWGGYGYNYQYLGNSRRPGGIAPFHASTGMIRNPSRTIAVADTKGSPNADGIFDYAEGAYVVDPPLQSFSFGSRGSRRVSANPAQPGNYGYTGGGDTYPEINTAFRATPDPRNTGGRVAVVFCDGHASLIKPDVLDDSTGDGVPDNGYWSGQGDPGVR